MRILGRIELENIERIDEAKVHLKMRIFFEQKAHLEFFPLAERKQYLVRFFKPDWGESVDCLIEILLGDEELWLARAVSQKPDKAFSSALDCLAKMISRLSNQPSVKTSKKEGIRYAA